MTRLEELLEKTSRTFALSIPVLPEPTRRQVMIGYLLFRIADTFEDAAHWPPGRRVKALREFQGLLSGYSPGEAARLAALWTAANPSPNPGYRELIAEVPRVLEAFFALDERAVSSVRAHVIRSAEGMAGFVERSRDGVLALADTAALREYCYAVAGIVGEMLTDLFLLGRETLAAIAPYLRERAAAFGEALQLVNIVKDAATDVAEGRSFLPRSVARPEIFALARGDLGVAREYTPAPRGASSNSAPFPPSSPGRPSRGSRRAARAPRCRASRSSPSSSASIAPSTAASRPSARTQSLQGRARRSSPPVGRAFASSGLRALGFPLRGRDAARAPRRWRPRSGERRRCPGGRPRQSVARGQCRRPSGAARREVRSR